MRSGFCCEDVEERTRGVGVTVHYSERRCKELKINHPSQGQQGGHRLDWQTKAEGMCRTQEVCRLWSNYVWDPWDERYVYGAIMVEQFRKASRTAQRTFEQVKRFESFGHGAALYQMLCPRADGVSMDNYETEQRLAASSQANMLATMKKYVEPGVAIKQPETLALWSNLVWNLMREKDRISEDKALLHPLSLCAFCHSSTMRLLGRTTAFIFQNG